MLKGPNETGRITMNELRYLGEQFGGAVVLRWQCVGDDARPNDRSPC